jgi:hypothetical protein
VSATASASPASPASAGSAGSGPSGTVHVHIGLPKTGTTHLQNLLWYNRGRLAEQGLLYPGKAQRAHFAAAMDLQGSGIRGVQGAWQALVEEVGAYAGPVVVSHELLARCTPEQVREVVTAFSSHEVHVVVTLRDFSRIVSATWQERAKNRQVEVWPEFLDRISQGPSTGHTFWSLQDTAEILGRWAQHVPAHRIHVVTVPPLGADPGLLVRRFGEVVGFDAGAMADPPPRANESIGAVEVALLQRVNRASKGKVDWETYRRLVKHYLVPDMLASRSGQLRVVLPESSRPWVEKETQRTIDAVQTLGCDVAGDLDELAPTAFGGDGVRSTSRPEDVDADAVLAAAGDLAVDLVTEVDRLRGEVRRLRRRGTGARQGRGWSRRARAAVVARSRSSRSLGAAVAAWRRLRRR